MTVKRKKPSAKTTSSERKLCAAVWQILAQQAWEALTPAQIAKVAKLPLAQVQAWAGTRYKVLPLLIRSVTAEVAAPIGAPSLQDSQRDRLFEVLMARFDVLQRHRVAVQNVLRATRRDRRILCALLPAQREAMGEMLALAGIESQGWRRPMMVAGLATLYAVVLGRWTRDTTPDMAKTMALLDRALGYADKIGTILTRV